MRKIVVRKALLFSLMLIFTVATLYAGMGQFDALTVQFLQGGTKQIEAQIAQMSLQLTVITGQLNADGTVTLSPAMGNDSTVKVMQYGVTHRGGVNKLLWWLGYGTVDSTGKFVEDLTKPETPVTVNLNTGVATW